MILFFAADSYGQINNLYNRVSDKISDIGKEPDWIIHVGSFGIWPDPKRVDRATRLKGLETDFHKYYLTSTPVPYKTLVLPGKHEDHRWLNTMFRRQYLELLPNLHHLVSGHIKVLANENEQFKILGLGKVYSPNSYEGNFDKRKSICHYTRQEVEKACSRGPIDIFVSAEAGYGCKFGNLISQAQGINNIVWAGRPNFTVHGHYNYSAYYYNERTEIWNWSLRQGQVLALEVSPTFSSGRYL